MKTLEQNTIKQFINCIGKQEYHKAQTSLNTLVALKLKEKVKESVLNLTKKNPLKDK